MPKKIKIVKEDVVEVKPTAAEPVHKSEAQLELERTYAADKERNPELYALKNKDAELARKLSKLQ